MITTQEAKDKLKEAIAYKPLQYGLIILVFVVIIYFVGKKAGKGVSVSYPATKTVDALSSDWVKKTAPNILDALFQAFDGYSADVDEKTLAVYKIINITDNQLTYIFNAYNQRYLAGKKESLYSVIDGEYFGPIGPAAQAKRDILKRMRELGMDKLTQ